MVWFLASRSLRGRPLRTFLTALGIAVAVGSMVMFLSLGEGLRKVFAEGLGNVGPDLQVSYGPFDAASLTAVPELPLSYLDDLQRDAEAYGIEKVTPLLLYVRGGLSLSNSFIFEGLPPEEDISNIYYGYTLQGGRTLQPSDDEARVAVVGSQTAERSGLGLGDTLRLNPEASFEIVGIAKSEGGLADNTIFVPLKPLQEAIGIRDRVTFFALELADSSSAAATATELAAAFPKLGFQTRGDVLGVIEQGVRVTDVVRLGISAISLIVGAIAVANTMLMSVFERTKEFGVVRALGAKPRFLFGLVLVESVLLSLVGAVFGVAFGRLGIVIINRVTEGLIGLDVAALTVRLVLFAVAVAVAMGLGSGLLPAARAARIPVAVAMSRE